MIRSGFDVLPSKVDDPPTEEHQRVAPMQIPLPHRSAAVILESVGLYRQHGPGISEIDPREASGRKQDLELFCGGWKLSLPDQTNELGFENAFGYSAGGPRLDEPAKDGSPSSASSRNLVQSFLKGSNRSEMAPQSIIQSDLDLLLRDYRSKVEKSASHRGNGKPIDSRQIYCRH